LWVTYAEKSGSEDAQSMGKKLQKIEKILENKDTLFSDSKEIHYHLNSGDDYHSKFYERSGVHSLLGGNHYDSTLVAKRRKIF
jgi:hypothetical protein